MAFVNADDRYAVEAFDDHAVDCDRKGLDGERWRVALEPGAPRTLTVAASVTWTSEAP